MEIWLKVETPWLTSVCFTYFYLWFTFWSDIYYYYAGCDTQPNLLGGVFFADIYRYEKCVLSCFAKCSGHSALSTEWLLRVREMAGCVLLSWPARSQPEPSGRGEGRSRTLRLYKANSEDYYQQWTHSSHTDSYTGRSQFQSQWDQILIVIQSRPVIQILIHSLLLAWYPETCDRVWIKMNILTIITADQLKV